MQLTVGIRNRRACVAPPYLSFNYGCSELALSFHSMMGLERIISRYRIVIDMIDEETLDDIVSA